MAHNSAQLPPPIPASTAAPAAQHPSLALDAGLTPATLIVLQAALSDRAWVAEWIIDPAGEASIVVLAVDDDPLLPAFLLHSRNHHPHVATVADDVWEADQSFASWPEAAAATVLMAHNARGPSEIGNPRRSRGLRAA